MVLLDAAPMMEGRVMAGIDDLFKGNILAGLAIGVGVVVLAPVVVPLVAGIGKPLAKAAIKTGITLYDRALEATAEMGEVFEDLVAEARAELQTPAESAPLERAQASVDSAMAAAAEEPKA
jgi:hypothetical protein